jgi:AcrR family transcriptional regulator
VADERSRRDEIIDVALQLFSEGAMPGLRDVGRAVGMTHAGVLYHVADKNELLAAMLKEQDRRFARTFDELFAREPMGVLGGLDLFATSLVENPEAGRLYLLTSAAQLETEGPAHDYVVRRYRNLRRRFADAILDGQERGDIRPEIDATDVATEIQAFLDGIALQTHVLPGETDPYHAITAFQARLLESISTEPSR